MNSRWCNLSNLWRYAVAGMMDGVWGRQAEPTGGSTAEWGEFRLIIKDFPLPLISLGHFYVFFIFYLIAAVSCLLIYTHWQRSTKASRDGALYPAIFFTPLVPPPSVFLSLPPPPPPPAAVAAISLLAELDLTKELPLCSFLISNKTLVWQGSYSPMMWHTEGRFPCARTQIHTGMSKSHGSLKTSHDSLLHFRAITLMSELITATRALLCKTCAHSSSGIISICINIIPQSPQVNIPTGNVISGNYFASLPRLSAPVLGRRGRRCLFDTVQ